MNQAEPFRLILASTSQYRRALINKFGIQVDQIKPLIDEEVVKKDLISRNLLPLQIAEELAWAKGRSAVELILKNTDLMKSDQTATLPLPKGHVILSGDQLVSFKNQICGQPHTQTKAMEQLKSMRGEWHELITSVVLWTPDGPHVHTEITKLKMHKLSDREIQNYVLKDNPIDCAGSYKFELSGAALFEQVVGEDLTSIQGLPLIWLSRKLKEQGYEFFN